MNSWYPFLFCLHHLLLLLLRFPSGKATTAMTNNDLSTTTSVPLQLLTNQTNNIEKQQLIKQQYEHYIVNCLSQISHPLEGCVQKFELLIDQHRQWLLQADTNEPNRDEQRYQRYCCIQNEFKDCWTASIRSKCSEMESRLTKWLPLKSLTELRTNERCRTYVLYPHKCRANSASLIQILAFLLLVPFVAFMLLLSIIMWFKSNSVYSPLKILHISTTSETNEENLVAL